MQKIIDNFLVTILYFEVLANSGVLERYLNAEKSSMVRSVFAKMWGLGDNENNSSEIIKVGQKIVAAFTINRTHLGCHRKSQKLCVKAATRRG